MKYISLTLFFNALFLAAGILLTGCNSDSGWQQTSGIIWNTAYNVTWEGATSLTDSIIPATYPVDSSLSVFNDSSLVSKVNMSLSTPVNSHFEHIYTESRRINRLSGGMFDPTLSPAITAWGFGKGHRANSDTLRCDSLKVFTGIDETRLRDGVLYKDDIRTEFNFSALAKGYGVDLVSDMFKRNGVCNYLVEIGGEIVCSGLNSRRQPWHIAIDVPESGHNPGEEIAVIISMSDGAVATSGNYRNYHNTKEGAQYGHTISPLT
ncbi:MAG: FAD:protein FMN transferase, partial [Muribaculaceae bacterium]|nr:FAD:protein FMN transferase [Muribaculaceae bacterium]